MKVGSMQLKLGSCDFKVNGRLGSHDLSYFEVERFGLH